MKNTKQLQ